MDGGVDENSRITTKSLIYINKIRVNGAQKRTRTSTPLPVPAPEAGASTNSAIWAQHILFQMRTGGVSLSLEPHFVNGE